MLFFGQGDPRELGTCSRKKRPFEEINESVEITKEKDRFVLELAQDNNEKDVV